MLSRALILATVIVSIGYSAIVPAQAQNLDAGKSPSQIFSSTCSACHRSQRGLLKTVQPGALPGFLREHYTTSRDMAQQLSAFLLSNGATDNRIGGGRLTKQGEDAKSGRQAVEPRPADAAEPQGPGRRPRPVPQEAGRPDADGLAPSDPRVGRTKRGRADQAPQTAPGPDGQPVATDNNALTNRQKQKMGKKKGREEAPKEAPAPVDAAKPVETKPVETQPVETTTPEADKPAPAVEPIRPPTPKPDVAVEPAPTPPSKPADDTPAASSTPAMRPDPVPQVTPAPKPAEPTEPPSAPSSAPSGTPSEPTAPAVPRDDAPPAPTISITPPPPPPPAGPATPPISQ